MEIKVVIKKKKKKWYNSVAGVDDKASECDLDSVDDWDLVIYNNNTLQDLDAVIDKVILEVEQELKKNGVRWHLCFKCSIFYTVDVVKVWYLTYSVFQYL